MSNDVVVRQANVALGDIERMAVSVAKSGLFGVKTADQALALMLVAQAEGRHPALAARDYDIIQGRPAKKAEAMMRDFLESGGKVEWHQLDDKGCAATFSHPSGGTIKIDWTMARAVSAGLGGRDMWKKYPRQMLRSRVVSEGIRTVCPMATSGMYVPEEIQDIVREKVIKPTSGAGEELSAARQDEIKAVADKAVEWLNQDSVGDALQEIENANLDNDEKVYLWTFLDSKQRRLLKAEAKRLKDAQAALPAPQNTPVSKLISDAQRKRLEARISELKLPRDEVKEQMRELCGKEHFADLTTAEYEELDQSLDNMTPAPTDATEAGL